MKRSIRLDNKLLSEAAMVGSKTKRSIASQIEYWAELGKMVEETRSFSHDLKELKSFNVAFMSQVQRDVESGDYRRDLFVANDFVFEKSKMGQGLVDKVFADGKRITGQVVNGEFVEHTKG